jgi:hypothetical protein
VPLNGTYASYEPSRAHRFNYSDLALARIDLPPVWWTPMLGFQAGRNTAQPIAEGAAVFIPTGKVATVGASGLRADTPSVICPKRLAPIKENRFSTVPPGDGVVPHARTASGALSR